MSEDKPDFEAIASKMYYDNHNEDVDHILILAMNFVWSSHVEPLQEKLSGFDSLLDTMNDQAKREFNLKDSRIRELEEKNKTMTEVLKFADEELSRLKSGKESQLVTKISDLEKELNDATNERDCLRKALTTPALEIGNKLYELTKQVAENQTLREENERLQNLSNDIMNQQ